MKRSTVYALLLTSVLISFACGTLWAWSGNGGTYTITGSERFVPILNESGDISAGLIDINTAGPAELADLPGIGPVLSQRIIVFREENGLFESVDDLLMVSGIGEKKLAQIKPYVTVGVNITAVFLVLDEMKS